MFFNDTLQEGENIRFLNNTQPEIYNKTITFKNNISVGINQPENVIIL